MELLLGMLAFYGVTIWTIVSAVVNAVKFCGAKKKNKLTPGTVSKEEMREYKIELISSLAIACLLTAVVTCVTVLMYTAVAYM